MFLSLFENVKHKLMLHSIISRQLNLIKMYMVEYSILKRIKLFKLFNWSCVITALCVKFVYNAFYTYHSGIYPLLQNFLNRPFTIPDSQIVINLFPLSSWIYIMTWIDLKFLIKGFMY